MKIEIFYPIYRPCSTWWTFCSCAFVIPDMIESPWVMNPILQISEWNLHSNSQTACVHSAHVYILCTTIYHHQSSFISEWSYNIHTKSKNMLITWMGLRKTGRYYEVKYLQAYAQSKSVWYCVDPFFFFS